MLQQSFPNVKYSNLSNSPIKKTIYASILYKISEIDLKTTTHQGSKLLVWSVFYPRGVSEFFFIGAIYERSSQRTDKIYRTKNMTFK